MSKRYISFLGPKRVLVALLLVLPSTLTAQNPVYTVVDLGVLQSATESTANDINDRGEVVGDVRFAEGNVQAFIWKDGVMNFMGNLGGRSFANAINNRGHATGFAEVPGFFHAFLFDGTGLRDLGTLPNGSSTSGTGINDFDVVVGTISVGAFPHAFRWQNGVMTDLGTMAGGDKSEAFSINNAGQITGYSSVPPDFRVRAFRWQSGAFQNLFTLDDASPNASSRGDSINTIGAVAGTSLSGSGLDHAFRWSGGVMTDLGALEAGEGSIGKAIDDEGRVVGTATRSGSGNRSHAFMVPAGQTTMIDLNTLIPADSGWELESAHGISSYGIVGVGFHNEKRRAFLLIPGGLKIRATAVVPCEQTAERNITYDFTATNTLPIAAGNVVVRAVLPTSGVFVSATNGGTPEGDTVVWNLGTLAAGQNQAVSFTIKTTNTSAIESGLYTIRATGIDPIVGPSVISTLRIQPRYLFTTLATGTFSFVNGVNFDGVAVGTSGDVPVIWQNGVEQPLFSQVGEGYAISDGGVVAGLYTPTGAGRNSSAFRFQSLLEDLGPGGGFGINNNKEVAGSADVPIRQPAVFPSDFETHAVVWRGTQRQDLGAFPGVLLPGGNTSVESSVARDISNTGIIVGWGTKTTCLPSGVCERSETHAFISYGGGALQDLGGLGGPQTVAFAVNDSGQAVGESQPTDALSPKHATLWGPGIRDLGTIFGQHSVATAINNSGQIVGDCFGGLGSRAFLWENGTMYDLSCYLPSAFSTYTLQRATGINDSGQIVGAALGGGQNIAYLITPSAPKVIGVTPLSGPARGGTSVSISGSLFATGATVTVGGVPATNVGVINDTLITATVPPHTPGSWEVTVTNPDLQSGTLPNGYRYNSIAFVRGDANGDGSLTVADIFYLINALFSGGTAPVQTGDVNGDGAVTVADVFYLMAHLFGGGPGPQ